jgi:hypothetical protein
MRVMLRLWRDYLAGRWDYWDAPVQAAVSYALPGKEGNLYRFDGWKLYGKCKPWAGGGEHSWSNPSKANEMGDGIKSLWYYPYPSAARDISTLLGAAGFDRGAKPKKHQNGLPGYLVTNPAPGAVRVQYYCPPRASGLRQDEMLPPTPRPSPQPDTPSRPTAATMTWSSPGSDIPRSPASLAGRAQKQSPHELAGVLEALTEDGQGPVRAGTRRALPPEPPSPP